MPDGSERYEACEDDITAKVPALTASESTRSLHI